MVCRRKLLTYDRLTALTGVLPHQNTQEVKEYIKCQARDYIMQASGSDRDTHVSLLINIDYSFGRLAFLSPSPCTHDGPS